MKKILVIEDDQVLQQAYHDTLMNAGYTVVQAYDGRNGINLANSEKPDLIILDILLPGGMDGFSVLSTLKKDVLTKPIPVIVMTNVEEHLKTSLETGAVWYFVKSDTQLSTLIVKVKEILNE